MSEFKVYWENICKIYFLTKHYLLLCEEYSDEFDTFLQPVKEHRDAFDHIARVYGYKMLDRKVADEKVYRNENMNSLANMIKKRLSKNSLNTKKQRGY